MACGMGFVLNNIWTVLSIGSNIQIVDLDYVDGMMNCGRRNCCMSNTFSVITKAYFVNLYFSCRIIRATLLALDEVRRSSLSSKARALSWMPYVPWGSTPLVVSKRLRPLAVVGHENMRILDVLYSFCTKFFLQRCFLWICCVLLGAQTS